MCTENRLGRSPFVDHPSRVERILLSQYTSLAITSVGTLLAIFFGIASNWLLTTVCIISFGSVSVSIWFLRLYSGQLTRRHYSELDLIEKKYKVKYAQVRAKLETAKQKVNRADELRRIALRALDNHHSSVEALHIFAHSARDSIIHINRETEAYIATHGSKIDFELFKKFFQSTVFTSLDRMLEDLLRVFQPVLPPGSKPWVALRSIRESVDGRRGYATVSRAGLYNRNREESSQMLPEEGGLAEHIRIRHHNGSGVVILSREEREKLWRKMDNDKLAEDRSLMAAPVFLKCRNPIEMPMIIFVNSPKDRVITECHKPYMRCCSDIVSMWLSRIVELVPSVHPTKKT